MLPPGLTAQPADRAHHQRLRHLHPDARTVVRLLVGACSCDLVRPRHADPLEDERHHRARHREARGTRDALLATLERHRRGAHVPAPPGGWPRALAAFVAEHARNAGETLYLLTFGAGSRALASAEAIVPVRRVRAREVLALPEGWLAEETAVIVGR